MGLWYPKGFGFELTAFSDADHAGCVDTRKTTYGGTQFLALPEERFQYLVKRIGMRCLTPAELEGRMPTKIELTLEQSQQGVSNDVLVSIEGVEELKRNVWIKGLKKDKEGPLQKLSTEVGMCMCKNNFSMVITSSLATEYDSADDLHVCSTSLPILERYQVNSNDVSFIEPYERLEHVVIETDGSSNQNGQADQNDQNDQHDHPIQDD
ncbi:hypothetical protein Tco_0870347 [Tanacetum coccineum]